MPQLIKKIESELINDITNDVILIKSVFGEVQEEDYIKINGFVAYLQNFSKIENASALTSPLSYGLKNQYRLQVKTLNINY